MAPEAVLFDLDGTIWDSWPWYAHLAGIRGRASRNAVILEQGQPAATILRQAGVTPARFPTLCERNISTLSIYPGVRRGLEEMSKRSIPSGIVTNLPGWIVLPMLRSLRLQDYFGAIVDYGRPARRKPHPEPLLITLRDLGIAASPAIWYVGDSISDCQAARAAGVSFAWASYGYGSERPPGTDKVITRFRQALSL